MKINDKIAKHTAAGNFLYDEKKEHLKSFELQCQHCETTTPISKLVVKVIQYYDDDPYNGAWYDTKNCLVYCPECKHDSQYREVDGFGYVYELSSYFNRTERV